MSKIAVIGAGNIGEALLAGLLTDGTAVPADLWATDVASDRLSALGKRYGIKTGTDNREAAAWADVVVLAVKPQTMSAVLDQLKDCLAEDALIISVATGIPIARMAAALGGNRSEHRLMNRRNRARMSAGKCDQILIGFLGGGNALAQPRDGSLFELDDPAHGREHKPGAVNFLLPAKRRD